MTNIEKRLEEKIEELEKVIKFRKNMTDNKEGQEQASRDKEFDVYEWLHCGEEERYEGRLEALKDTLESIHQDNLLERYLE